MEFGPIEEFAKIKKGFSIQQQLYQAAIKEIRTKLEILDEEFRVKYDHNPIHHIESRLKSVESIVKKLQKKDLEISIDSIVNNLSDVAGVRVICNYKDDVESIAKFLVNQDDITYIEQRDYISNPKENGYRSLHLIIAIPIFLYESTELVRVEVQIRTIAMDFWASLEHKLKYKKESPVSNNLYHRLQRCAINLAALDEEMQDIYRVINEENKEN
ncbi:GTP pyrophosphokinase family protein [Vallitaleaceae bacterium 9-2]